VIFSLSAVAQIKNEPTSKEEGPATLATTRGQVVDENAYYRIPRLDLAPGAEMQLRQHNRDIVFVVLGGDGLVLTPPKSSEPEKLTDGEARFFRSGVNPRIANPIGKLSQALLIELKQHWDAEIRPCTEPMKCTRPIRMGELQIGETTSLFTNGFVSAYRHRLASGATLTSSYFSATGKDHLLLVPLTALRANFGGTDEALRRGQAYTSDATEIEVNAGSGEVRWVVIRVQIPRA